ncbi:MAG: phage portal protein [Endomicrobiia bacterium]
MLLSFQNEYTTDLKGIVDLINNFKLQKTIQYMKTAKDYYNGNNSFICNYKKMIYNEETESLVVNAFVPNYKNYYGFFGDMVSQKNNNLLTETPLIDNIEDNIRKKIGFTLKSAGVEASICGYSFIYETHNNNFKVFNTEECIGFTDDFTGELKVLIRFYNKTINNLIKSYFEIYDENGITIYEIIDNSKVITIKELEPYKYNISKSLLGTYTNITNIGRLPIALLKNNDAMVSDLTNNIKCKIDLIDLISSGLINNIEEFSDVWMSVVSSSNLSPEDLLKMKQTFKRAKSIMTSGMDSGSIKFNTLEIPYQARTETLNYLKQELVEDAGTVDYKQISGNATAVEINSRTEKLKQRVSDFEWFIDETATDLVLIYQLYNNLQFDINISFKKLFMNNQTEAINIATQLYDKISKYSFLKYLQDNGIAIDSVEEELLRIENESVSKFDDEV